MKLTFSLIILFISTSIQAQFSTERVLNTNYITKPSRILAVDINNDGKKDLLSYSVEHEQLVWNRRNCTIGTWESSILLSRNTKLTAIITNDIDLDGDNDIIAADDINDNITIYRNDGSGGFNDPEILIQNEPGIAHLELADLDNDGDLDLAISSNQQKSLAWYTNSDGHGSFENKTIIKTEFDLAREILAADVDGDNDLDLIASGKNEIIWFENLEAGSFNTGTSIATESSSTRIVPVDFDFDGDLDIIAGSYSIDEIHYYENQDGAGNFSSPQLLVEYPDIYGLKVEDLDGDKDYEIIVSSYIQKDEIVYFEQLDIPLTFSEKNIISDKSGIFSFDITDMNSDGFLDIIVPRYHSSELMIYDNYLVEQNSFIEHRVELGTNLVCSITTADIDQDGFLDILSASDKLIWYKNLGQGDLSFEEIPLLPSTTIHDCKAFDGDKDDDIDIYYSTPDYVYWLNNENGSFTKNFIGYGQHFAVGDINGDSYMDVVRSYTDIFGTSEGMMKQHTILCKPFHLFTPMFVPLNYLI